MQFADYETRFPALVRALKNARNTNRMSHAYLLHGDNHRLREDFAVKLAMLHLCDHRLPDGSPCGVCAICDKLQRGVYPELHQLRPSGKMRFIKVGSRINPDPNTLRWFEDLFYLTTNSAYAQKVGIVYDVDRMNQEAQTAFLKTLEEPPPNTFFILTTGNPAALLPTTRSRCQTLMMLENRTEFDFSGCPELLNALAHLSFKARGRLAAAEHCAAEVIRLAGTLKAQANTAAEQEWSNQLALSEQLEPAARKRIEEQFQAAAVAEYLRLRMFFLSAMHTWFAQLYLLASGATMEQLPNPDFFAAVEMPASPDEDFAYHAMKFADELIFNLRFNVDESLALRTFCLNVAVMA
ncbi:MAG: hypothetical protein PHQ27_06095 [Victivallales bacterium]|nr:hypothetical protein [Victivallales bacterium]